MSSAAPRALDIVGVRNNVLEFLDSAAALHLLSSRRPYRTEALDANGDVKLYTFDAFGPRQVECSRAAAIG